MNEYYCLAAFTSYYSKINDWLDLPRKIIINKIINFTGYSAFMSKLYRFMICTSKYSASLSIITNIFSCE